MDQNHLQVGEVEVYGYFAAVTQPRFKYSTMASNSTFNDTCLRCPGNTYSTKADASQPTTCTSCPPNSQSASGSSMQTSCQCHSGYTGADGGNCLACTVGKYKEAIGSATCTDWDACKYLGTSGASMANTCTNCSAGTYSTTPVASEAGSCAACPANAYSPPGSTVRTACLCNTCYETSWDNNEIAACTACESGMYKPASGSTSGCVLCESYLPFSTGVLDVVSPYCVCRAGCFWTRAPAGRVKKAPTRSSRAT
jgi:hypothetical protein